MRRDTNMRNREWPTQMQYSPAYLSQTANPVLPNGMTEQLAPAGTIPRGFQPFHYRLEPAEAERAGRELKNPFEATIKAIGNARLPPRPPPCPLADRLPATSSAPGTIKILATPHTSHHKVNMKTNTSPSF